MRRKVGTWKRHFVELLKQIVCCDVKTEASVEAGEAAFHAARKRLRPILMTFFAIIAGVAPLALATGAGSAMRQVLGTAVFFAMLGVTVFGLLYTPVFYTIVSGRGRR